MTIYTPKHGEKGEQKSKLIPQVVTDDTQTAAEPRVLTVTAQRRKPTTCANVCVIITAVLVLTIGVVGGIYLYKHLAEAQRTFEGFCGVSYYELDSADEAGHYKGHRRYGKFEERVQLDKEGGKFEKIEVPDVDDCQRATVLHDFEKNVTAIVDQDKHHCFVMPLNTTAVKRPRDFWDLISKLYNGYYIPDVKVVRERYRVVKPPVRNLMAYGQYVLRECQFYDTYRLKRVHRQHRYRVPHKVHKRSLENTMNVAVYDGRTSLRKIEIELE